jgi:hypothetical protein
MGMGALVAPGAIVPVSKLPLSAVAVCATLSELLQDTDAPLSTVTGLGVKAEPTILAMTGGPSPPAGLRATLLPQAMNAANAPNVAAVRVRILIFCRIPRLLEQQAD